MKSDHVNPTGDAPNETKYHKDGGTGPREADGTPIGGYRAARARYAEAQVVLAKPEASGVADRPSADPRKIGLRDAAAKKEGQANGGD